MRANDLQWLGSGGFGDFEKHLIVGCRIKLESVEQIIAANHSLESALEPRVVTLVAGRNSHVTQLAGIASRTAKLNAVDYYSAANTAGAGKQKDYV